MTSSRYEKASSLLCPDCLLTCACGRRQERNAKIGSDKLKGAMKIKARLPAVFIPKDHPLATSCVKAVEKVLNETPDVRHFLAQQNPSWGRPRWLLIAHLTDFRWVDVGRPMKATC